MKRIATTAAMVVAVAATGLIASGDQGPRKFSEVPQWVEGGADHRGDVWHGHVQRHPQQGRHRDRLRADVQRHGEQRHSGAHSHRLSAELGRDRVVAVRVGRASWPAPERRACNVSNPLDNRNGSVSGTLTAASVQALRGQRQPHVGRSGLADSRRPDLREHSHGRLSAPARSAARSTATTATAVRRRALRPFLREAAGLPSAASASALPAGIALDRLGSELASLGLKR